MHILGKLVSKVHETSSWIACNEHINTKTDLIPLVFLVQILLSSVSGSLMVFI